MQNPDNTMLYELDRQVYLPTFDRYPLALDHGRGARVWDIEGVEYIDALAGIAVNSVGHCHPAVVKAIQAQAANLIHISNFYVSEPQVALSQKLTEISGLDRIFLTNSGAEAVEGAIKIARKYAHNKGRGGTVISFTGSFHGRTLATIATGQKKMQQGFEPMPQGFEQAKFNDLDSVKSMISDETAAIIIEPIQGESGIHVADPSFLRDLRTLCTGENIVLIFDEIQCGIGRTGRMFAKEHYDVQPDIMTLAKALGGGVPIGAVLSNETVSSALAFGDHGTTFGGNPLVCAAALATLDTIETEGLLRQAAEKGQWLTDQLQTRKIPGTVEVRGKGLMLGVEFDFDTKSLAKEMLNQGVLTNAAAGNVLRIVPPLMISYDDLETVVDVLESAARKVRKHD